MDGNDDFNKTIKELIKEKTTVSLTDSIKYVEIKINGSITNKYNGEYNYIGILTPRIRYILKK